MAKKFMNKKSKRVSAKKRYKVEKKVKDHNRKIRRLDKKKEKSKPGKRKLIIVPGDCPFKGQILAEASALKENILREKLARREQIQVDRKARREQVLAQKRGITPVVGPHNKPLKGSKNDPSSASASGQTKPQTTFEELLKKAQERGYHFEKIEHQKTKIASSDSSLKAFYREFQQVVSESDVVIQVLDSRDPLGTRSSDAEEAVRNQTDKKLMMVLNKCDLIPADNLQKWIAYLKETANCVVIPFKANTQKQKDKLGSVGTVNTTKGTDTKKSVGVSDLMGILGTWARGSAGGITVGVIGMPNVGKSSLINSLKRSKACNVGAKPGITRTCQVIHLDSKLRLIDSPGICFSKETGNESITLEKIISRVPKTTLMLHYRIPEFQDSEEFLCNMAIKYGQLKKGGIPNTGAAENKLIHDWHTGAIRFFTEPPELASSTTSAAIVSTLSEPFSLDNFVTSNDTEMAGDDDEDNATTEDSDAQMSEDEPEPSPTRRITRSAAKSVSFSVDKKGSDNIKERRRANNTRQKNAEQSISPDAQQKLGLVASKKTLMKKLKKSKKKSAKKADELSTIVKNMSF